MAPWTSGWQTIGLSLSGSPWLTAALGAAALAALLLSVTRVRRAGGALPTSALSPLALCAGIAGGALLERHAAVGAPLIAFAVLVALSVGAARRRAREG